MGKELNVFVTRLLEECRERSERSTLDWGGLHNAIEEAAAWVEYERYWGSLRDLGGAP